MRPRDDDLYSRHREALRSDLVLASATQIAQHADTNEVDMDLTALLHAPRLGAAAAAEHGLRLKIANVTSGTSSVFIGVRLWQ